MRRKAKSGPVEKAETCGTLGFTAADRIQMYLLSGQLHVLHDFVEQVVHPEEASLSRLEPPPMPKEDINFRTPEAPHSGHLMVFSAPIETRLSKHRPHVGHRNSYMGMTDPFYHIARPSSTRDNSIFPGKTE